MKSTHPRIFCEVNTEFWGVKIFPLICTFAGPFGRVVKTAFNVSPQTFWENYSFREDINFSCQLSIPVRNFCEWQEKTGGCIIIDVSRPGVCHQENLISLKVFDSRSILCSWQETFGSVLRTDFYVFWAMFWRCYCFQKNDGCSLFWVLTIKFGVLL